MDILKTNEVNCKDCYKCVRYCPVNAIKISDGHAQVVPERCILDGKCYKICPQKAKTVRNDVIKVKEVIKSGTYMVASIAPSFFAYYNEPKRGKILTALKFLGFDYIEQTSRSAYAVSMGHLEHFKKTNNPVISSSCPSSVSLIEKYYPELIPYLAPVVSPVIAHYKMLEKEIRRPFKMVFIGPCIAKKEEIDESNIFASVTFEELEEWIKEEDIDVDTLNETDFEKYYPLNPSLYPLLGGLIATAGLTDSNLDEQIVSVNGVENIKELFESLKSGKVKAKFIEILACEGGCVMGPMKPDESKDSQYYELKNNLISSHKDKSIEQKPELMSEQELYREYKDKSIEQICPTEEEIRVILASIGKTKKEHEHNCGACGYNTCREKAIAVIQGMAEKEMCIPYMRSQAERFSAIVLEATPNCVVVLDNNLNIIEANPAFQRLTSMQKEELIGKHISLLTDEQPFIEVRGGEYQINESRTLFNGKDLKRIVFSVPDQKLITGIFVDITDAEAHKAAFLNMKKETLDRAQKVIDKQMRVAQEVAGLLGETTAETKVLLGQLVKILQQE